MKILTIDLEDWFHILAHEQTSGPVHWEKFESRVEANTDWILEQLARFHQPATFFCLGWIVKKHPGLIRKISDAGYEIACHSMNHQLVYEQSRVQFKNDLVECMELLQRTTGKKVVTYRAPGFSVSEKNKWIFEMLVEAGIENDCSVFPAERNHGGYKNFGSSTPCLVNVNGVLLKEFPISLATIAGRKIVYSGGGYFRLLPYAFISSLMKRSDYVMTYFHPRDFDAGQPVIESLPLKRKFMSYTGLRSSRLKFVRLLEEFTFTNVETASRESNWNDMKKVNII